MRSLTVSAPAKINLFLGVGATRPDGYHDVVTVLHGVDLADTIILTPADELTLTCDTDLGVAPEKNLAYRAAAEFSRAFEVDVLIDIALHKRIPSGAGLGGGSSDAAAVLAGLAHWASLPLADSRLQGIAGRLGADVPFFLAGGAALMEGRGDALTRRLEPLRMHVVLVKPESAVATTRAYEAFDRVPTAPGDLDAVLDACAARDPRAVGAALANNMTDASASLVPQIAEITAWLVGESGVLGAAMAGSGSAVFAICETADVAERLAGLAGQRGWWSAATLMRERGVVVELGSELA
jgi:4-diphosphocytidyl-2-C-methyl-D-erythritol kinase